MSIESTENAHRFMTWLNTGIVTSTLSVNKENSLVHFLPEGMALVSPMIFMNFAKQDRKLQTEAEGWKLVQKHVLHENWHIRVGAEKLSFLKAFPMPLKKTSSNKKVLNKKVLNVVVIENPAKQLTIVPDNTQLFSLRLTAA